jgi:hypothetical protein
MTRRSCPSSGPTSPWSKVSLGAGVASRMGSALRAWSREGRRQRGSIASAASMSLSGGTSRAAMARLVAAAVASSSSGAGGSPSRRRLPKIPKAIAIATAPVDVTSVGAAAKPPNAGPLIPSAERALVSGPRFTCCCFLRSTGRAVGFPPSPVESPVRAAPLADRADAAGRPPGRLPVRRWTRSGRSARGTRPVDPLPPVDVGRPPGERIGPAVDPGGRPTGTRQAGVGTAARSNRASGLASRWPGGGSGQRGGSGRARWGRRGGGSGCARGGRRARRRGRGRRGVGRRR